MINIYDVNGRVLMQAEITNSAIREEELSKSDYISLSWNSAEKVVLPVGAYIVHTYKIDKVREVTRQFLLLESYEPTQSNEMAWKYTPEFHHPKMILSKIPFYIRTRNSQNEEIKQHEWSFVGTMKTIADKLKDFLNNEIAFGTAGWNVVYDTTNANVVNVSFDNNDFISALTAICNAIGNNCEWHIDYDNEIIYICKTCIDDGDITLEVGKNVGIPSVNNSKESYYNSFAVFGGTRNITQVNNKGENIASSDIRLQLAPSMGTLDIDGEKLPYTIDKFSTIDIRKDKKEPLFTKVLEFSQIYPSLNTYVYNVRGREKYVIDSETQKKIPLTYNSDGSVATYKTFTVWYMRLAYPTTERIEGKAIVNTTNDDGVVHYWYDFEVTDKLLINGKNLSCSFEANFNKDALSTPLAGRGTNGDYVGFELSYHKEASSSHASDDVSGGNFSVLAGDYEIIYQEDNNLIIPTNESEMIIPRGESKPTYKCNITVLYNIAMAESIYTKDAQKRLFDEAIKEIQRLKSDLNNYSLKSYPQVFEKDNPCLQIGQKVTYNDGNGYLLTTRVLKLSTNIDYNFEQVITLGNEAVKGSTTQLKEKVDSIIASGSASNNGGYTTSQLSNIIAKYGTRYFLSKQYNDTAQGLITFAKGLIAKGLADLMMGAKFGNNAMITELGDAVFNTIKSFDYDNAAEQGFSVEKEKNGKYHAFITNLTIWGKAIFNQLEVRKLSYAGGNVYLSGAGSKIVKVAPVIWESESSEWMETSVDKCEGWLCYLLADDGTTATQNLWREGDQVRCKTIGTLATGTTNASNKSYWRTIPEHGVSSVNEKIYDGYGNELYGGQMFSWIVIGKHSLSLDSMTEEFATAEIGGIPEAGDTIVLDGHRAVSIGGQIVDDYSRKGVLILESTGENTPRIVGFKGVDRYTHNGKEVFVISPDGSRFYSNLFEWVSPSGDTMHMVNYRGEWKAGSYSYYDQVNHNNALWTCINENGTSQEPSDASSDWQKVLSGEKGDKGDKGEDGTSVTINGQAEGHYANFAALKADASNLTQQKGTVLLDKSSDYSGGFATPSTIDYTKTSNGSVAWSNVKKANIGDCYILSTTKEIYSNSDGTAWKNLGNIQGPKGDKGDKGENGATGPQGNPGADGAKGEDGVSILIAQPIVLDTNDNGIVSDTTAEGRVMVMRGGENVTNECSDVRVSYMQNCTAEASLATGYIKVKLNSVNTTTLASGDKVSVSEGFITIAFSLGGKSYSTQVSFSVNVSKYMGSVKATAKQYQSQFEKLENDLKGSNPTVLKAYTSTIKQTAKEITLSVTQSQQGRHNLLRDTALTRKGDIYYSDGLFQPTITQGVNGHNAIRFSVTGNGTPQYKGLFWGQSINGIAVKKNTDYTFSAWIKSDTKDLQILSEVFKMAALNGDRGENIRATSGNMQWQTKEEEVNQWRQVNYTFNSGDAEFIEVNIFVYNGITVDGTFGYTASGNGWICMPMLEEGSEYTGWTPAKTDYDYLGGNMLDDTRTLVASGQLSNLYTSLDVAQDTYEGAYAVVHGKADSSNNNMCDFLRFNGENGRLLNFELRKNYVFSFLAKGSGTLRAHLYKDSVHVNIYAENSQGSVTENVADGASNLTLTSEWKRYWVHWRVDPYTGDGDTVLPQSVLLRAVDGCEAWVTKPKLEEGALMTEYTEKKTDLIDKATAKAAGLEITADGVELYGDKVKVKNNGKTAAMFTDGKLNADLIDADTINVHHVWAKDGNNQNTLAHFGNYDIDEAKDEDGKQYPLWVGSSTASNALFKVSKEGYMYAKSGKIAGFDIIDNYLHASNKTAYTEETRFLSMYEDGIIFSEKIGQYYRQAAIGSTANAAPSTHRLLNLSDETADTFEKIGAYINVKNCLSNSVFAYLYGIYVNVEHKRNKFAMYAKSGRIVTNDWMAGLRYSVMNANKANTIYDGYLDLSENNVWFIKSTAGSSHVLLPTLSNLKEAIGMNSERPSTFRLKLTIIGHVETTDGVYIRGRTDRIGSNTSYNTKEYPLFLDYDGGQNYWALSRGDVMEVMLYYDGTDYYAQLLTLSR